MTAAVSQDEVPAPRQNSELLGQEAAEGVLLRAAAEGRLPHAWLLTGVRGVGKATLAYRFARFLLAGGGWSGPAAQGLAVPPDDPVFRRVAAGGHLNLLSLEPQTNPATGRKRSEIRVDEVRKAISFLQMTPADSGWRIVVVDAADDLNQNAANALLKALEEPPQQALLLLVSHAPGQLRPTIRSRCCHLALTPLSEQTVAVLLSRYAPALAREDAAVLALLAEGSIGRALELADSGGLELYGEMVDLLGGLMPTGTPGQGSQARLDVARLHRFADRLTRGADAGAFRAARALFIWWLARMIRTGSLGRMPRDVVAGEGELMAALLACASLAQWVALWDKVNRLLTRVESANLDRKQAFLSAFLELEALVGSD